MKCSSNIPNAIRAMVAIKMLKQTWLGLIVALFIVVMPIATLAADKADNIDKSSWPAHLRFLCGPAGGQWFFMGEEIAELLSNNVLPTSSRQGGGISNLSTINNKMGDLGFTLNSFLGVACAGAAEFKDVKVDDVVLIADVYPQVLYFLVRKDFALAHNIVDVETMLKLNVPVRFASLKPGTASEFILSLVMKYGYDTNFDKLRHQGWQIDFNNYAEIADKFTIGEFDCFAYTAGTNVPLILTMESHTEVMILPVSREVLDLMTAKFGTNTYTVQPGIYKSVNQPVNTLGDYTSIAIRKDLPDSLVYVICQTLWQGRDKVATVISDFGQLSLQTALPGNVPVHPGAVKYWREMGAK